MVQNKPFDIAIIGGGLAGLCLAIQSADKGYHTILFEKEQYPFHKVCGEYISLESWSFLKLLGVPLQDWDLPLIKTLLATDVTGKEYRFNLDLGGFGISRYKLDDCLYQLACSKGVTVKTQTKVLNAVLKHDRFEIETTNAQYLASLVAGSFGKRTNLDVKWNRPFVLQKRGKLNNYIGVKYHIQYPTQQDVISLHNFKNGYCGMSAIEDGKSCLCYLTTADNLQKSGNSIAIMEQQILGANPQLKKIFQEATILYSQPLTISQVSFLNKNQVENNILMMGDAAGMITPLCGNGMSMAMHGSKLAFNCFNAFLSTQITRHQMEEEYKHQWQKHFAKRLWVGRRVQELFGGNFTTALFLKLMKRVPVVASQVIKATHGSPF
ncbi:MAG: FAD-binding protein [Chitinophagaceae bacterium]|nr:FAD-binding protein [Chitinophagaceae bacterium]